MSFAQRQPKGLPQELYEFRARRVELDLTQAELAERARVSVKSLIRYELGQPVERKTVSRLEKALVESGPAYDLAHCAVVIRARTIVATTGWSKSECAERCGVPDTTWHNVVSGLCSRPTPKTRQKFREFVEKYDAGNRPAT